MNILHRFHRWLRIRRLAMFCPRFWEDMPADQPGQWVAVSLSVSPYRPPREVEMKQVEGLRNAYIEARALAVALDCRLPHADGELGGTVGGASRRRGLTL